MIDVRRRPRVLMIVQEYPQISETYIETERRVLAERYDVHIIALNPANRRFANPAHHQVIRPTDPPAIIAAASEIRPDVIHGHYFHVAPIVAGLGQRLDVPATLRCHSFDILDADPERAKSAVRAARMDSLVGMLTFPFTRPILEGMGVAPAKIVECWPVIDFDRFHDETPNGTAIMNVGAALPKKNMDAFIRLGTLMPGAELNLYAMGYRVGDLQKVNEDAGAPITIVDLVEPPDMPEHYKHHRWLVYTASHEKKSVGWPLSVAEAQAAGLGVMVQRVRPDLADYVGEAGYLFDEVDELPALLARPFPEEKRRLGFAHARRSDVRGHIHLLEDLWRPHLGALMPAPAPPIAASA